LRCDYFTASASDSATRVFSRYFCRIILKNDFEELKADDAIRGHELEVCLLGRLVHLVELYVYVLARRVLIDHLQAVLHEVSEEVPCYARNLVPCSALP